ncbi:MAG: hypothetical protein WCP18_01605 [bacterium]
MPKKIIPKKEKKELPKINLYRNISFTFIALTLVLLVAVFVFFYSQAVIVVTAKSKDVTLSFDIQIKQNPTADELSQKDVVAGYVVTKQKTDSQIFDVLGTKTIQSTMAGRVKIINKSNRNQPLVQTTQLADAGGNIVRINSTVMVPAGGSVMAEVYPKEGTSLPTITSGSHLTIIKLNASLQDKIYATADGDLSTGPRSVKVFTDGDLNRAQDTLFKSLSDEVKAEFDTSDSGKISVKIGEVKADKKIGDTTDSFNLTETVTANSLVINQDQLLSLLVKKITESNITNLIGGVDLSNFDYVIADNNFDGGVLIKATYLAHTKLQSNDSLFDKRNFAGRKLDEVKSSLAQSDLIQNVDVRISPYWSHEIPRSTDKIKIIIK